MKWIGQHIWDSLSRFRSDVYLESISSGTIASGGNLGLDSNNKVVKATAADGDITGVDITGGTNLTVASETGTTSGNYSCTLNVDDAFLVNNGSDTTTGTITAAGFTTTGTWTFDEYTSGTIGITTVQDSGTTFNDNDTSLMTAAAVDDRILDYGYGTGDITGVTLTADDEEVATDEAGSADFTIAGGEGIDTTSDGSSTITISGELASTSNKGVASFNADDFSVSSGVVSLEDITVGHLAAATVQTSGESFTDNDTSFMTSAAANDRFASRAYFQFKGYGTSDGTNYDLSEEMSDNQAPFQHDHSTGSDGLTAQTTNTIIRSGGKVMPYAGVLKKFSGWATVAGTGILNIGIFKFTPVDNNNSNVAAVLLVNEQITGAGNTKMRSFSETSSFDAGFSAGDILYSAVKAAESSKIWYMNSTIEVEWS